MFQSDLSLYSIWLQASRSENVLPTQSWLYTCKKKAVDINLCSFQVLFCTETAPSLWDVEFAKQVAAVNEQPFQNAFEEMIQWTKEGKLWAFPIDNEAGKSSLQRFVAFADVR